MANTNRRIFDREGKMFVPMDMDGGYGSEGFLNSYKLITGVVMIFIYLITFLYMRTVSVPKAIIALLIVTLCEQIVFRKVILEEKKYIKVFRETRGKEVVKPDKFWDVPFVKDNGDGAVLMYSDAKIGVIVRLEKGVITGQEKGFREMHYDSLSDAYNYLVRNKMYLSYLNLMELTAGEERLRELDKLSNGGDNPNLNRLVEKSVNHLKDISMNTMEEVEYFEMYSRVITRPEVLLDKVNEVCGIMMNGGYSGYSILGEGSLQEINEFSKKYNRVEMFNFREAVMGVHNGAINSSNQSVKLKCIVWDDGSRRALEPDEVNKLLNKTSGVIMNGGFKMRDSVKSTLVEEKEKNNFNGGFRELEKLAGDHIVGGSSKEEHKDEEIIDF